MKRRSIKNPVKELESFVRTVQDQRFHAHSTQRADTVYVGYDQKFGTFVKIDGVTIAIDRWNPSADIIFVSHAHMDHVPILPNKNEPDQDEPNSSPQFLCSKITKEMAEARTNRKFNFSASDWLLGKESMFPQSANFKGIRLTLIENGHTYGSTSLFVEGSETILCTGDYITEDRALFNVRDVIRGLKPMKCDRLITECTFGAPKFVFPPFSQIKDELNIYINQQFAERHPVILLGYEFGKSQLLLNMIDPSFKVLLERNIARDTKILESNGLTFREWEPYGNYTKKELQSATDYVLIIPPHAELQDPYKSLISAGAKVVAFSGKVLSESYRGEMPADAYFPLSDHCDFNKLINFIKCCEPKVVYLEHGSVEELSYALSKLIKPLTISCVRSHALKQFDLIQF